MNNLLQQNNQLIVASQLTSFIGREGDIGKVKEMLAEPSCRLVSLVGSGGIGKTRLGMQIAMQAKDDFTDFVYFVPLQGLTSIRQITTTIAKSIGYELHGKKDALTQLKHYLHDKQMLILLDNFEHLLDAVNIVVDLLDAAPELKIIVTSREVLNLRAEWVWSVAGMQYPDRLDVGISAADSAVHLFNTYAQRLSPDFSLDEEKTNVIRICQLVGGVPLAIELAASWLKSCTCEVIAEEIQRNLDFLDTNMRDMPERHRSMRAVIDQSWKLLSDQEKNVFRQLAIFRGGFTNEAGYEIVGASRIVLSSLVSKSLLSYNSGRYHLHELLRQYAQQELDTEGDVLEQLLDAHANYYFQFLADRLSIIRSDDTALNDILQEMDNIYLAWDSVAAIKQFEQLPSAIYCFGSVVNYSVGRHEGIRIFAPVIDTLREQANFPEMLPSYVALLTTQSVYHSSLMQLNEAIVLLEECQALLEAYDFRPQAVVGSDPLVLLGKAHLFQGNFDDALDYGYKAVAQGERYDDVANCMMANQLLGMTYLALGKLDEAMQYGHLALSQSKQSGNAVIAASCADHLGDTAILAGDFAMGEYYYQEGYRYRQEINELTNLPLSLSLIGKAKLAQGQYQDAAEWLGKSLTLFANYDDTANIIVPKAQLATCYVYMNEPERARELFLEAINAAELTRVVPLWLMLMSQIGEFLILLGNKEKGVELLTTIVNHPMFNRGRDMIVDVEKQLADIKQTMPDDEFAAAQQRGIQADFDTVVLMLEHWVRSVVVKTSPDQSVEQDAAALYAQGLEPLSERELEVLGLIADGLTNQEIGDKLIVTVGTVKSHTHSIYTKFGVKNRTQAVNLARQNNLF